MADGKPRSSGPQKAVDGKDKVGLAGVGHKGLVTERDIDSEFGLFAEEPDGRDDR